MSDKNLTPADARPHQWDTDGRSAAPIETLEREVERARKWDEAKADFVQKDDTLAFMSSKIVCVGGNYYGISGDGLGHLCEALKHTANGVPLPARFLRDGTTGEVWAHTLAEHSTLSDKSHMLRTFDGNVEAVVADSWPKFGSGTGYEGYENSFILKRMLEACQKLAPTFVKVHTHTPGDIVLKLGFSEAEINIGSMTGNGGRVVHAGIMIANSEWRSRRLKMLPFIMTSNCDNSTVTDASGWGFAMNHVGQPAKFTSALTDGLTAGLKNAPALIEAMAVAGTMEVEGIEKIIANQIAEMKLPKDIALVAMRGIGLQRPTVLAVHDALTYAAHSAEMSEDDSLATELFASAYLLNKTGQRPNVIVGGERDPYAKAFAAVDHDGQPVEVYAE